MKRSSVSMLTPFRREIMYRAQVCPQEMRTATQSLNLSPSFFTKVLRNRIHSDTRDPPFTI